MRIKWWRAQLTCLATVAAGSVSATECAADLQAKVETASASELIKELVACVAEQQTEISDMLSNSHEQLHNHDSGYSALDHSHDGNAEIRAEVARLSAIVASIDPVPAVGNDKDTKAIVAYSSEKGEKTCPAGWSPYEEAKDRFVVGAGGKYPVVGSMGGEETVTLLPDQLPRHNHPIDMFYGDRIDETGGQTPQGGDYNAALIREDAGRTKLAGAGLPHNNMPPYIALYFCKKD